MYKPNYQDIPVCSIWKATYPEESTPEFQSQILFVPLIQIFSQPCAGSSAAR